jgi:NAD(P)-dependent dehydrogenase (short-subunit alcohol dehydrogenase family)
MGQRSPLGRIGQPDDVAVAVSWLISPEASYVTGSDPGHRRAGEIKS